MEIGSMRIRLAEIRDVEAVTEAFISQKFSIEATYGVHDFQSIIELSLYSFVALSSADEAVVGFASFNDSPLIPSCVPSKIMEEARTWAIQEASDLGFLLDSLLWLEVCAVRSSQTDDALNIPRTFLRAILTLAPDIQAVLHPSPSNRPALPHLFKSLSHSEGFDLLMCACTRSTVLSIIKVRRAIEEDYDDLLPVIERSQKTSPLAQVPETAIPSRPYAVARLIASQDDNNAVFVAEVENRLVGIMSTTATICKDYCYDFYLEHFHGLTAKEIKKFEIPITGAENNRTEKQFSVSGGLGSNADIPSPAEQTRPSSVSCADVDNGTSMPPSAVMETQLQESDDTQEDVIDPGTEIEEPEEEPKFRIVEVEVPVRVINAFEIRMLCIDKEFENQAIDFVAAAFEEDRSEYCLVGFPHTRRLHPLLEFFTRASQRPSRQILSSDLPSTCMLTDEPPNQKIANLSLYLLHRDSMTSGFEIRRSQSRDAGELAEFLEGFKDVKSIIELIEHPRKGCITLVALQYAQIVGFVMIEENVPVEALYSNFKIDLIVDRQLHTSQRQACMTLFVLLPAFRHKRRFFLREAMRQSDKTVLYYPIFPQQELADVVEDLVLVPARQHAHISPPVLWGRTPEVAAAATATAASGGSDRRSSLRRCLRGVFAGFDCTLYLTTHRLTCRQRLVINSRIVVVGASTTAEAFLHKLFTYPQMFFTNLTLVSPSGFAALSSPAASVLDIGLGPARKFCKLGLDCHVNLKMASVVDLDRQHQTVTLSNDSVLSYDVLILTCGIQDQTSDKLNLISCKDIIRAGEFCSGMDRIIGSLEKLKVPRESVPENEGFVVIYGGSLEAYSVIQLLLSKGIKGSNILVACREERLPVHGDANVMARIQHELSISGVTVKLGLKLMGVCVDDVSGSLSSVKFQRKLSEEESDEDAGNLVTVEEESCCLLITCDRKQVDSSVLKALRRENITFDGRIVVDGRFRTNDDLIYAAGTVCKFSRRCGKLPTLENFCSVEVGEALASSIISSFTATHLPEKGRLWVTGMPLVHSIPNSQKWIATSAPSLSKPKFSGGILPGTLQYFSVVLPSCYSTDFDILQIQSLITKHEMFYGRVDVVERRKVGRIIYVGHVRNDSWKFQQLVGLPISLLNNLTKRYSEGIVDDVVGFLMQPWCSVVFHDEFVSFYGRVCALVIDVVKGHPKGFEVSTLKEIDDLEVDIAASISILVKKELLNFVVSHRAELPMYNVCSVE